MRNVPEDRARARPWVLAWVMAAAVFGVALSSSMAYAFPPYRSTDAETADPWVLEGRVGLIRLKRDAGKSQYESPLARVNFGLPHQIELLSEFEYLPAEERVGDAALGFKWIPFFDKLSVGIEALALLPVSQQGGVGTEMSLLGTLRSGSAWLHANVGGFYDARPVPVERGWKTGLLGEIQIGSFRPGLEVFATQVVPEPVQLLAGAGLIVDLGPVQLRGGVHLGITAAAPDLVTSLWVSGKLPVK